MKSVMRRPIIFLVLILSICILANSADILAASNQSLRVSFIDVGQGDAILIQDASGFNILIDGGRASAGPTVVAYLHQKEVTFIDVMVASHAHADHIGGLISVLQDQQISVQEVLYNGYPYDSNTWSNFTTAVADQDLSMSAAQFPQVYDWGSTIAYILHPDPDLIEVDQNRSSIVILLVYEGNKFLFSGDIDFAAEATIVARGTPLAAEILKVAHHGSSFSSSEEFLSAVSPEEAVIQVGRNTYGHPAPETIGQLEDAGARVWRNDIWGTIIVESNGSRYTIYALGKNALYLPLVYVNQANEFVWEKTASPVISVTVTP
jgi:competence protein ComEC